jgi:hypothetical protein
MVMQMFISGREGVGGEIQRRISTRGRVLGRRISTRERAHLVEALV